ncbi:hypothetical protein B4U80_06350, partial [Leptotrombidium deliense]
VRRYCVYIYYKNVYGNRLTVSANIWCYSCMSSQPGCGQDGVNWWIHGSVTCPREDDKCVKIIEKKGVDVQVTRGCLSEIINDRRDVPADTYEGCRPAAAQPKVGVYVENHVKELDIKRQYWDEITYCFCEFDEWCNSSVSIKCDKLLLILSFVLYKFISTFL